MRPAPARVSVGATEEGKRGCGSGEAWAGGVADVPDARAKDGADAVEPQPASAIVKAVIASSDKAILGALTLHTHLRRARAPCSVARARVLAATAAGRAV